MSASVGGDESGQEVEINIVPIIDAFTVLIAYLLATASFLTLTSLEVGVAAIGTSSAEVAAGPPPIVMTLEMKSTGDISILVRGGKLTREIAIAVRASQPGAWNLTDLDSQLTNAIVKWPELNEVSILAEPTVLYKDIVTVIHAIQKTMPKVYISG